MSSKWCACFVIVLAGCLLGSNVAAEESEEVVAARLHDRRAQELFDAGDFSGALREMEAAQAIMPSTTRLYNMAACNEQLGDQVVAIELYREFVGSADVPEGRRQRAQRQLQQLEEEMSGASPETDGEGQGDIENETESGELEGGSWSESRSGDLRRLSSTPFYAVLGVTAASGIALIGVGVAAISQDKDYWAAVESCPQNDETMRDLEESGPNLVVASNVMLGITSTAALATVILAIFTDWSGGGSTSRQLNFAAGPGLLGFSGAF